MMFSSLPVQLGAYTLLSVLFEDERTASFLAVQTTMEREVMVTVLRPEFSSGAGLTDFVAMVRAKAAVQFHAMGAVFEALNTDGYWYYTKEKLPGVCVADMAAAGRRLSVAQLCKLIRLVGEASDYFDALGVETVPLTLEQFTLGEEDAFRFANPVTCGRRDLQSSEVAMSSLAAAIEPLLPLNQAGQTRIRTLCTWMKDGYEGHRLKWFEVNETLDVVEEQLGLHAQKTEPLLSTRFAWRSLWKDLRWRWLLIAGCSLSVLSLLVWLAVALNGSGSGGQKSPAVDSEKELVYVSEDSKTFVVPSHAVSIREYAAFLDATALMEPLTLRLLEEGVPSGKSHVPGDWDAMYGAARRKEVWEGVALTLDSPVVNVDYWDALVYARYVGGILPDKALWQNVASRKSASRVREWTGFKEVDQSRAMDFDPSHAIDSGGGNLQYLPESGMRKKDLGFRVIFPK